MHGESNFCFFMSENRQDGSLGPSFKERTAKKYFPESFGWHPSGDPFEHKRAHEDKKRREAPARLNGAAIPVGTYLQSCKGPVRPRARCCIIHCTTTPDFFPNQAYFKLIFSAPSDCFDDENELKISSVQWYLP